MRRKIYVLVCAMWKPCPGKTTAPRWRILPRSESWKPTSANVGNRVGRIGKTWRISRRFSPLSLGNRGRPLRLKLVAARKHLHQAVEIFLPIKERLNQDALVPTVDTYVVDVD